MVKKKIQKFKLITNPRAIQMKSRVTLNFHFNIIIKTLK